MDRFAVSVFAPLSLEYLSEPDSNLKALVSSWSENWRQDNVMIKSTAFAVRQIQVQILVLYHCS